MQSIRNKRFANLRARKSCAAKPECRKLKNMIAIFTCMLVFMLYGCSKPGASEPIGGNAKDETAPLFPALALMDAASFDRLKIEETDTVTCLTSSAYLSDSADGNLGILSGEALDEKGVLSLGEASVGQMPDGLKTLWGKHGIDMVEPEFWPDRSITSAAFEDAGEPGMEYCHLRLSCGLIDAVYVIFQKNMDSEYIPRYVLVNNCERTEAFVYTMFSGMDWAVYRSTSERGTGVSETTVSWLNLTKGKHELIYAEHRTEQESFMNQSCPSQTIESTLQSIEDDSLHLEVAMCFELSSESNTLSRTEKKTDMALYYNPEIGGFYIKLPPEAYLISPLQLDPIRLQEYLLRFDG